MPLNTDLNVSPYFDDFNEDKNFQRILFRPSTPIQARELTQLQSILQNQIERFGNYTFRNGDIVQGCTITDVPVLPYVRLSDFQSNGSYIDLATLSNTQVVCATSNLQARVITSLSGLGINYPNTNIIYLKYLNTGTSGETSFSNTNQLTFYKIPRSGNVTLDTLAVINVYSNSIANTYASGNAHGISVSDGIVFISGNFVRVSNTTFGLVNPFDVNAGNNVVGFQAIESIVTENQDSSLLDNALGYSNENAPGAHRLKIVPTLISLDPVTAANTNGFNPIATYNYGSLVTKSTSQSNVYSILGQAIAKRTYEESGNYVVNPFVVDATSIGPANVNNGANNFFAKLNPGIGYVLGSRVELQQPAYISMRRGVDTAVQKQQQITFNYGGYYVCNEVSGDFPFNSAQSVDLYDQPQKSVTNRTFSSVSPSGNKIGTATIRNFNFNYGIPGTNTATYFVHLFNFNFANGYNSNNVKSLYYNGSTKGVSDIVTSQGYVGAMNKDQLYSFGVTGLKSLRDQSNNNNAEYIYRSMTSSTMYSNGDIVITLPVSATGGIDILPYGTGIISDTEASSFIVNPTANADTLALSGTVSISNSSTTVTGSSTTFNVNFHQGSLIKVGSDIRTIVSVTNATSLIVDNYFSSTLSGQTYYKSYVKGKFIHISQSLNVANVSYVNITNSTSFTIKTNQSPNTAIPVDVYYNVLRTNVSPATKAIKKDRFVKINTSTNPKGPWCLGYSDIHQIKKIYGGSGTYTTSGTDLTQSFVFDSGQKDTHYGYGYIYLKPGVDISSTPNLLVQLDYFSANTSAGVGFFTVESYPIDDTNTSNNNAIQTKDIPLYIDEAGNKAWLRDYIDFRIPSTPSANDTGIVDTSNTSQVTTAISYATINPSSNIVFNIPASGLNVPAYSKNMQSDFTYYLPRKDIVLFTPDNVLKIKEGVPSTSPQTPLYPENAMAVAVLNIPAYPSLTSDQIDSVYIINKTSKNLIRDTTSAISTSIVTNKRYTMRDVGKLDQRITNLEYYTQLTLLEKKASELTVTDANGLNRFKNGFFVDAMSDFSQCDISNPEFSIAIDSDRGVARPRVTREVVSIDYNANTSVNVQKTGRCITLPYTETAFLVQPFATKYRSSALVAYAWNGKMTLIPSYDNHQDIINTGSINFTVDNFTAWKDFSNSPMGSIWGDWRTTTNTVSTTVRTGTQSTVNVDLGYIGWFGGHNPGPTALSIFHKLYGNNAIVGSLNTVWVTAPS